MIRAVTGTPCTSNVRVSPSFTPSDFAISSSTEIRASRAASSGVHQRPATTRLAAGGAEAQVRMYSRVRCQRSSAPRAGRALHRRARIAARRARTTGISSGRSPPARATSSAKGSTWSGCTSTKKKAGARSRPAPASSPRRFASSSATATISITARPSVTSTGAAWLPGRCEVRERLPPRERAPRRQPSRERDDQARGGEEQDEPAGHAGHEEAAHLPRAGLPQRERGEDGGDRREGGARPRAGAGVHLATEHEGGRDATHREERPERAADRDAHAHREPAQHGERRDAGLDGQRQQRAEQGDQRRLDQAAERRRRAGWRRGRVPRSAARRSGARGARARPGT